ncbi:MAG: squalene synthase HpnC [Bacteroidetes bacterium]|nr:squalene synthase HpnC [Bacteroidota bacterium]
MQKNINEIETAYKNASIYAANHYENFPVVSIFIPKRLRKHIAVIYQFARMADDIADEGNNTASERIKKLNSFEIDFAESLKNNFKNDFWAALKNTIDEKNLTPKYFYDLLKAFKQDVDIKKYASYNDVLNYCRYSANPVGRLILELFEIRDEKLNKYSDNICTALQLTNFYQDISIDIKKGRIYIPLDEMKKFDVDENVFVQKDNNVNFKELLRYQVERTRVLFTEGKKLIQFLPLRLRFEISWTVLGGEKILEKIENLDFNVLNYRPKLKKTDYIILMLKSFLI